MKNFIKSYLEEVSDIAQKISQDEIENVAKELIKLAIMMVEFFYWIGKVLKCITCSL